MILEFKTKRDTNGNTYTLALDTDKKKYSRSKRFPYKDLITITKKDMRSIVEQAKNDGYKEV